MVLFFSSVKKKLNTYSDLVKNNSELISKGLSNTCCVKMKEVIDYCEGNIKDRLKTKQYWWVYGMACILYEDSLLRFGMKSGQTYFDKARKIGRKNSLPEVLLNISLTEINYFYVTGRIKKIKEFIEPSYKLLEKVEEKGYYETQLQYYSVIEEFNKNSAGKEMNKLLALTEKTGTVNNKILAYVLMADIELAKGRIENAVRSYKEAISLGEDTGLIQIISAYIGLGNAFIGQNKIDDAKKNIKEASKRLEKTELKNSVLNTRQLRTNGILAHYRGNNDEAVDCLTESARIAKEQDNPLEEGMSQLYLGEVYLAVKDYEQSRLALELASGKFIIIDNQVQLNKVKKLRHALKENQASKSVEVTGISEESKILSMSSAIRNKVIDDFMKSVMNIMDINEALSKIIDFIMQATNAGRGTLVLVDDAGQLHSEVIREKKEVQQGGVGGFQSFSRTFVKKVIETGKHIWMTDTKSDDKYAYAMSIMTLDIRSVICVPVKENKKSIGVIYIDRQAIDAFTEEDFEIVKSLAEYASVVLKNAQLHSATTKKLQSTQDQLVQAEKLATIGTLAAGVAHEINNPMGAILTSIQTLKKGTADENQVESFEIIEKAIKRCQNITKQLLTYGRTSSKDNPICEIQLKDIIKNALFFVLPEADKNSVKIEKFIDEVGQVKGVANQLQQVFTNLLLNGIQATKQVQAGGMITIKVFEEGDYVIADIIDNGCGISEENIPKLFDPFFTTKEVGAGSGLGLSVCLGIIEKHNGVIEVSSKRDKGTTFRVKLPRIKSV